MRNASAILAVDGHHLLLGKKFRGEIGVGHFVPPGGRQEADESMIQCAVREFGEETLRELDPERLEPVAQIMFYSASEPFQNVTVFRTDELRSGASWRTDDMLLKWHHLDDLPYTRMFEADRHWLKRAALGYRFDAVVHYREKAKNLKHITFDNIVVPKHLLPPRY